MPILQKDGRSILFIHVPKAGGSAVERLFKASGYTSSVATLDGTVGPGTVNDLRRCTPQHMHAELLRVNFQLHKFDAIFMVVRDPIERFRSEYLWRNRQDGASVAADAVEAWGLDRLRRYRRYTYLDDNHIRPQWQFRTTGAVVYKLENTLEAAFADLNDRHSLGLELDVPRVRSSHDHSGRSSADVEISDRLRKALTQFYYRDYVEFGYAHEPVAVTDRIRMRTSRFEQVARSGYRALRAF